MQQFTASPCSFQMGQGKTGCYINLSKFAKISNECYELFYFSYILVSKKICRGEFVSATFVYDNQNYLQFLLSFEVL